MEKRARIKSTNFTIKLALITIWMIPLPKAVSTEAILWSEIIGVKRIEVIVISSCIDKYPCYPANKIYFYNLESPACKHYLLNQCIPRTPLIFININIRNKSMSNEDPP
jgi:hypothetical protein